MPTQSPVLAQMTTIKIPTLHTDWLKLILSLYCELPKDNAIMWVTVDEMCTRLIEGGVDPSLSATHISDALRFGNRSRRFITRRKEGCISYYCPTMYAIATVPIAQRKQSPGQQNGAIRFSTPTGFFLLGGCDTARKVSRLNDALAKYVVSLNHFVIEEQSKQNEKVRVENSTSPGEDIELIGIDGREVNTRKRKVAEKIDWDTLL